MFNVSSEFKKAIKNDSREFKSKVLIGEDEYTDDKIINFSLENSMAPSDEFSLGVVVASKFEMSIALNNIRNNKTIKPFIGLKVGNDFEFVPLGVFSIEEKSIKNGLINLSCYDNIGKLEKPYFSDLSYPATLQSIAAEICNKANVTFSSTLPNLKINKKIDGYTCREALSFIASACGGFAIANRTGSIEIKTVTSSTSSITGNNYFTFEKDDAFTIKKVTAHIDDNTIISRGTGIGIEEIEFKNPVANDSILDYIYSKLKDYRYVPGSLVWQGNPALDVGEKLTVIDISGINHEILIMRNKIVYEGGLRGETNSVAKSLGKSNFNYGGSMQGAVDRITAEQIVVKELLADKADIGQLNAINANIENLTATKADIEHLNATNAKIENLTATKADITDLNAVNATISNLQATKADIVDLNATNGKITMLESETAKIGVLEGNVANIKDVISGNISSDNIQSGGITGDRLNMNTIFVNDANIVNVNASKINAGEIDTSKVKVKSADGAVEIVGATQQFRDKNNKVRIQMGKDTKGDFNFILRGEDGTSTLIDHTGIKEKAITDNLIKDTMIAPDAVGEKQINYNSFATGFNKESNTTTLKATKVSLDNQNQTLDVGFTQLKNQADGTKTQTESNTTQINVQQGKIETAIANTTIIKNGKETLLKDDYNTTVTTVNEMKNTISSHTTKIDNNTGKITGVESKTNILERDISKVTNQISETETKVDKISIDNSNLIPYTDFSVNQVSRYKIWGTETKITYENKPTINNIEQPSQILVKNSFEPTVVNGAFGIVTPKVLEPILANEEYTLNFKAMSRGNTGFLDYIYIMSNESGVSNINIVNENNKLAINKYGESEKISTVTFKINKTLKEASILIGRYDKTVASNSYNAFGIWNIILSKGSKIINWQPSYMDYQNIFSDINGEISTTKNKVSVIEQTTNSITQRVSSVESTTTTNTATINSHTSILNAVDGKINTAKNQALNDGKNYTNLEVNKVIVSTDSKFAEIKTTTDSIDLKVIDTKKEVEKVDIKINDLKIGSANLLIYSDFSKNVLDKWYCYPNAITTNAIQDYTFGGNKPEDEFMRGKKILRNRIDIANAIANGDTYSGFNLTTRIRDLKVKPNTNYILSYYTYKSGNCLKTHSSVWGSKDFGANYTRIASSLPLDIYTGSFVKEEVMFNTGENNLIYIRWYHYYKPTATGTSDVHIFEPQLEEGTRSTDWKPSNEDISEEIFSITTEKMKEIKADIKITTDSISNRVSDTEKTTTTLTNNVNKAQSDAIKGINDAKLASDKATQSQNSANTANNKLSEFSNDNKLTASEKQNIKLEWDKIVGEKTGIISEATKFSVTSTDYNNKYNSLNTYITPLLSNLTVTSDIVGTTFRTNFTNYYNSRQNLLNAISTKAKSLADAAQNTANANKTEITDTNKKVSEVKTDLNGITSRVGKVEEKTTKIDGEIVAQEKRLASAESKITEAAIVNTVSKQFYKKGETDANYATKSSLTQTDNKITAKFEDFGGNNLIQNSSGMAGNKYWASGNISTGGTTLAGSITKKTLRVNNNGTASNIVSWSYRIDVAPNTKYTLSGWASAGNNSTTTNSLGCRVWALTSNVELNDSNKTSNQYDNSYKAIELGEKDGWKRFELTFTTTSTAKSIIIRLDNLGAKKAGTASFTYFTDLKLEKGSVSTMWTPHPEEIYAGITEIDKDGLTVTHSGTGNYSKMSSEGFLRYVNSSKRTYHYLMSTGTANVKDGMDATITLPNEFKGKSFQVTVSAFKVNIITGWSSIYDIDSFIISKDLTNGKFTIRGMVKDSNGKHGTLDVSYVAIA